MSGPAPLIVGAGPAGTSAAIHLLRSGVQPILVERHRVPGDALCGGFISWTTIERLESLGLNRAALGGHELSVVRVFAGRVSEAIPLPARAMALSRRRLDGLLLARAKELGVLLRHGNCVYEDGNVRLRSGEALVSDSLFIATGKHDLHGLPRPKSAAGRDPMLGLRLRLSPSPALLSALSGYIEIHLFAGGYLGVVMQEDGFANFCMAVRKSRLAAAGGVPAALIAQLAHGSSFLAERFTEIPAGLRIDAISNVPYGWRATTGQPGIFRLGDQAGVISSFAGEGIGVALASAESAVAYWRHGGGSAAPAFQRAFAGRLRRPLAVAGLIAALGTHPAAAAVPLALLSTVPRMAALIARITRV